MQQKVNSIIEREGMDGITKKLNTTEQTLQIIIDGLTQPESFDIRKGKRFDDIVLLPLICQFLFIILVTFQLDRYVHAL